MCDLAVRCIPDTDKARDSVKDCRESDLLLIELVKPVGTLLLILRDLLDWKTPVRQDIKH